MAAHWDARGISNEMVRAQKEFFGKGPTKAKAYMLDDMLIIVMRGGMTTAEKTMLDFGNEYQARQFGQLFENEMTERLTTKMEELTGRKIVNYQSQVIRTLSGPMAVYVDEPIWERGGQLWCHLTADTAEELHAFATRLGLRRSRFQSKPGRPWVDHYDIAEPKRRRAVALGAVELTIEAAGAQLARKRETARSDSGD